MIKAIVLDVAAHAIMQYEKYEYGSNLKLFLVNVATFATEVL
jgi:hypothetical protein